MVTGGGINFQVFLEAPSSWPLLWKLVAFGREGAKILRLRPLQLAWINWKDYSSASSNIYLLLTQILLPWYFSIFFLVTDLFENFMEAVGTIPETCTYSLSDKTFSIHSLCISPEGCHSWTLPGGNLRKERCQNKNEVFNRTQN